MIANEEDIRWIVKRIVALHNPDYIYLFGSYSKGTAHASSDLDLLIVAPDALPQLHRGKAVKAALSAFPSHFDLLFFTPQEIEEEMKNPYSFISSITASARLVYHKVGG